MFEGFGGFQRFLGVLQLKEVNCFQGFMNFRFKGLGF